MTAISHLYETSPSIRACRAILFGQMLGSGVVVKRGGSNVKLTDAFAKYLEDRWVPFARDVIDNFLKFGFAVVSIEADTPPPFAGLREQRKRQRAGEPPPVRDSAAARKQSVSYPQSAAAIVAKGVRNIAVDARDKTMNAVPLVPDPNVYMLSFIRRDDSNYKREYRVYSTSSRNVFRQDFAAEVFFREEPDAAGNMRSPVATVFQSASFISALEELALQAEVVRARQLLVTQPAAKQASNVNLDPNSLFFDTESRAIQSAANADDDAQSAESLSLSVRLCQILNRIQTTDASGRPMDPSARNPAVPPELPPRMFSVPEKQSVVPGVRPPEARSDLVELARMVNDHVCASMGVPASVVFEGKFSSNSMSQLQLLNTTVTSLSLHVNRVLTAAYHACFENAQEEDELCLLTAPLSSTEEIVNLFAAQIIDLETAVPAALHSLGCTAEEIAGALKRRKDAEDTRLGSEAALAASDSEVKAADAAVKREQVGLVKSQVLKTNAETQLAKHNANAPYPSASAGSSSSSSSSGGKK